MAKFKNKYRIESTRLKGFDYSKPGSYFITICTHQKNSFFGFIDQEGMHLNDIGELAEKFWLEIPQHFPHAQLDDFIIMPNHIHGIITIIEYPIAEAMHRVVSNDESKNENPKIKCGQTMHRVVSNDGSKNQIIENENLKNHIMEPTQCVSSIITESVDEKCHKMKLISPKPGSIPVIIGSFKSVVTKHARKINSNFKWQERFHDCIIRSNQHLDNTRAYIKQNPQKWIDQINNSSIFL